MPIGAVCRTGLATTPIEHSLPKSLQYKFTTQVGWNLLLNIPWGGRIVMNAYKPIIGFLLVLTLSESAFAREEVVNGDIVTDPAELPFVGRIEMRSFARYQI